MNNVNFTRKQMKRMEYCFTHPLFHEKKTRTAVCNKCGKRKYLQEMREIGFEVFICRNHK